jgi:hypothetical protein
MAFRDVDAALAEMRGQDLTYKLGGREFTVRTPLPAAPYVELVAEDNEMEPLSSALFKYLREVTNEEQREELDVAFRASGIDQKNLYELWRWIVETSTSFPTKPRTKSPATRRKTSGKSKAATKKTR